MAKRPKRMLDLDEALLMLDESEDSEGIVELDESDIEIHGGVNDVSALASDNEGLAESDDGDDDNRDDGNDSDYRTPDMQDSSSESAGLPSESSSSDEDGAVPRQGQNQARGRGGRGRGRGRGQGQRAARGGRGRGQAGARGRGRGRGRGQAQGGGNVNPPQNWTDQIAEPNLQPYTLGGGPNCGLGFDADALQFLLSILGDNFLDLLVENTNLYAAKLSPPDVPDPTNPYKTSNKNWTPTTGREMQAFIGINILMGIKDYPEYADYWSTDSALGDPYISRVFSKNQYERLCKYLHCSNPNIVDRNDKLDKVRPLLAVLNENFPRLFTPGENLSVDEAMVKFDGRLAWKQYMPKKPVKWGIKIWCLCDSNAGYILAFEVYTGAAAAGDDNPNRAHGLGHNVVMTLMRDYLMKNQRVHADNFFSSVTLALDLKQNETYYCGTIRSNRQDYPSEIARPQLDYAHNIRWQNQEEVLACRWRDRRRDVFFVSTYHGAGNTRKPRTRYRVNEIIDVPNVVVDYNKYMGGVDHADQLRSYYKVGRTGKKWWKYLFWAMLNVAVVNAYILWLQSNHPLPRKTREYSLKKFKLALVHQMVDGFSGRKNPARGSIGERVVIEVIQDNALPGHTKVCFSGRKRVCVQCSKAKRKTAGGHVPETKFGCRVCEVNLCRNAGCFQEYHAFLNVH
ncbi:piggyBac transposable element-derived protein 4-like [Lineus longissimus]|uniref:piggyBac transposable element-derived protein 4-like n=1 Tax=Lineus longissimus TaxID=88925 RepID=UPI00315D4CEC